MSRVRLPPALRALAETARALSRQAPSTRVALARGADLIDPALVPADVREDVERELERARAAACVPLAPRAVERVLSEAWGRKPAKVLDELDPEPLAVTAAAQVHRASVDGQPVAIKVQRPGLERAVRTDLTLLDALGPPLRLAFPGLDAGLLLRSLREQSLDELDLEHEGSSQRRVARALRSVDGIVVPGVLSALSAPAVLVTELLAGPTLKSGARPPEPGAAARSLLLAHLAAARGAGLALLDARPSHVVVLPGGGLGLLGAGVARSVDRARVELALVGLRALADDDEQRLAATVVEAGLLPPASAGQVHALARGALGELLEGRARLDAQALRAVGDRGAGLASAALALAPSATPVPDDLWIARGTGQLVALLARLGAEQDWVELVS